MNKELEESKIDMSVKAETTASLDKNMGKWEFKDINIIKFGSAAAAHLYYQRIARGKIDSINVEISRCLDVMNTYEPTSQQSVQASLVIKSLLEKLPDARKRDDAFKFKMPILEKEAKIDAEKRRKALEAEYKKNKQKNPDDLKQLDIEESS